MTHRQLFSAILALGLASTAQANSGRTADGCSYRIINGQYLTSCDQPKAAPVAQDAVMIAQAAPIVTSYDSIPMRANSLNRSAPAAAPTLNINVAPPSQGRMAEEVYETRRQRERDKSVDATYVGAQVGSTNISKAGSGTGVGVTVGSFIDDHFGFELGYSYAKQDVSLGLDSRGSGAVNAYSPNDAALKAHLISGEVQGYLTDTFKRLRPYLGFGLGWKSSSLSETAQSPNYGFEGEWGKSSVGAGSSGSSLSQSSLGGLGTAGAKFRIGKAFQLGFSFRYFFPIARQESRLEQGPSSYYEEGRLTKEDDTLTGASQYQLLGGLQYAF